MPEELSEQKMDALMKGNKIRSAKANDKRRIKAGELSPAEVLRKPPEYWKKTRVLELLMSMHRVGRSRANSWLWAERIDPGTELGLLPEMVRYRLARHVDAAMKRAEAAAS